MGSTFRAVFALSFLFVSVFAVADDFPKLKKECTTLEKPFTWNYCVYTTKNSKSPDVIYYFHGLGGSENTWGDDHFYPAQLRKRWAEKNFEIPTVVGISLGKQWLLVEKNESKLSGLYEAMVGLMIPAVEKALGKEPKHRFIVGESMGGFNGAQLALKAGKKMFTRAALLCPPMVTISPFSTDEEIEAFIKATKANPDKVKSIVLMSKMMMPTANDWDANNPVKLAENIGANTPDLYVSCGMSDDYGFFPGTEKFAEIAKKGQPGVQWRPLWGSHCAVDIDSLADFIAQ